MIKLLKLLLICIIPLLMAACNNTQAILPVDGSADWKDQNMHPSVLHFPDQWNGYEFWMAYSPYPNSNAYYENPCVAASHDGINWITPAGLVNPLEKVSDQDFKDGYHYSDPELVMVNGILECWFRFNKNGDQEWLFRKTSSNGINWSNTELVMDLSGTGNWALSPSVIYEDGKYKLWFCGLNNSIYYTESPTGHPDTWSPPVETPLSFRDAQWAAWHLDVLKDHDKYILIMNTMPDENGRRFLTAGESLDGFSFSDIHLILSPGVGATEWDNKMLYRASTVRIGDLYSMLYSAKSVEGKWHIGVAQGNSLDSLSKIGGTWCKFR